MIDKVLEVVGLSLVSFLLALEVNHGGRASGVGVGGVKVNGIDLPESGKLAC